MKMSRSKSRSRSPKMKRALTSASPAKLADSWPAQVPFKGKPRHPVDGSEIDWCSLHLRPPSPDSPWLPPFQDKPVVADKSGSPLFFDPSAEFIKSLRFPPAPHDLSYPPPAVLTQAHIDGWNKDGYLLPGFQILSAHEVACHSKLWQDMFDAHADGDYFGINGFMKRYGGAYDLVRHPQIIAIVRDLLGPHIACWGAHYICKVRSVDSNPIGVHSDGSPATHQDAFFWPFRPNKQAVVWLALDDVDDENGGMVFYPGSHLLGCVHTGKEEVIRKSTMDEVVRKCGEPVLAGPLRAGQISIHSDLTIHGSPWNKTSRRRLGVSIQYTSMVGVTDGGERWGHGVIIPDGSQVPLVHAQGLHPTFVPLERPAVYGPSKF